MSLRRRLERASEDENDGYIGATFAAHEFEVVDLRKNKKMIALHVTSIMMFVCMMFVYIECYMPTASVSLY